MSKDVFNNDVFNKDVFKAPSKNRKSSTTKAAPAKKRAPLADVSNHMTLASPPSKASKAQAKTQAASNAPSHMSPGPSNKTAAKLRSPVSNPASPSSHQSDLCEAIFDHVPNKAGELGFKVGDVILVTSRGSASDTVWQGTLLSTGAIGKFPQAYVKGIAKKGGKKTKAASSNDQDEQQLPEDEVIIMEACFDFPAKKPQDLAMKAGDFIKLTSSANKKGWCRGIHMATGKSGRFPQNFAKVHSKSKTGKQTRATSDEAERMRKALRAEARAKKDKEELHKSKAQEERERRARVKAERLAAQKAEEEARARERKEEEEELQKRKQKLEMLEQMKNMTVKERREAEKAALAARHKQSKEEQEKLAAVHRAEKDEIKRVLSERERQEEETRRGRLATKSDKDHSPRVNNGGVHEDAAARTAQERLERLRMEEEEGQLKQETEEEDKGRLREEEEAKERLRKVEEEMESLRQEETERKRKEEEEEERLRKEKEEEERRAEEELERLRKEEEEQLRKKKEEERLKKEEEEEQERLRKKEEEEKRLRKEEEKEERSKKEQEDKQEEKEQREKEEMEKMRLKEEEERERLRKETEEKEQLRKEEEEKERSKKEQEEKERLEGEAKQQAKTSDAAGNEQKESLSQDKEDLSTQYLVTKNLLKRGGIQLHLADSHSHGGSPADSHSPHGRSDNDTNLPSHFHGSLLSLNEEANVPLVLHELEDDSLRTDDDNSRSGRLTEDDSRSSNRGLVVRDLVPFKIQLEPSPAKELDEQHKADKTDKTTQPAAAEEGQAKTEEQQEVKHTPEAKQKANTEGLKQTPETKRSAAKIKLSPTTPQVPIGMNRGDLVVAIYNFPKKKSEDLALTKGDIILVTAPANKKGWMRGQHQQSKLTGRFPKGFVQSCLDYKAQAREVLPLSSPGSTKPTGKAKTRPASITSPNGLTGLRSPVTSPMSYGIRKPSRPETFNRSAFNMDDVVTGLLVPKNAGGLQRSQSMSIGLPFSSTRSFSRSKSFRLGGLADLARNQDSVNGPVGIADLTRSSSRRSKSGMSVSPDSCSGGRRRSKTSGTGSSSNSGSSEKCKCSSSSISSSTISSSSLTSSPGSSGGACTDCGKHKRSSSTNKSPLAALGEGHLTSSSGSSSKQPWSPIGGSGQVKQSPGVASGGGRTRSVTAGCGLPKPSPLPRANKTSPAVGGGGRTRAKTAGAEVLKPSPFQKKSKGSLMQHLHPASASPSRSSFASASKRSPIARSPLSLSSSSNKRNSPSASPAPAPVPTPAFTEAVNPYTKGRLRRRKTMRDNELTSFFTQGLAG